MSTFSELPASVIDLIRSGSTSQFATLTAAGEPIDTPLLYFPMEDLSSIELATGVAYPAKAERVRRNSKVGLLIEGSMPGEPVVSIAGRAATLDHDLQANLDRYLAENALFGDETVQSLPWADKQKAIWYWARIIMTVVPYRVAWWDSPDALDREPHQWAAPADTVFPASDPAPAAPGSAPAKWAQPPWRDLARGVVERGVPGHLSLIDDEGFPRPIRVRNVQLTEDGLSLEIPAGALGSRHGPACLTFYGRETFVGRISTDAAGLTRLAVDRSLPILPLLDNPVEVFYPKASTEEGLMTRLEQEVARRGQTMPVVPDKRPEPTPGSLRRVERDARLGGKMVYTKLKETKLERS